MKKTIIATAAALMTSGAAMASSDHTNIYISGPDRSPPGSQVSAPAVSFDYASQASIAPVGAALTSAEQERQATIDFRASNSGGRR